MTASGALARGRSAFEGQAWSEAYAHLADADRHSPLDAEDLDCLATAAYLIGKDVASADARTRAHTGFLQRGEAIRAARCAILLAVSMMDTPGQQAQAGGWFARARRLLEGSPDCVEQGFLICSTAVQQVIAGNLAAAHARFSEAARMGVRLGDPDLTALARQGEGRALLRLDRRTEGLAILDEVMVAVTCGEVQPMVAGVVYCGVISACHDLLDLRRAQEWTTALSGWCESHPDMVPFRGQCLVHRSELMQLHGAWQEALDEAQRACERLARPPGHAAAAAALCQLAEVHRLRGEFNEAEETYRRASDAGLRPHPGPALLRLARGDVRGAAAAIDRVLQDARGTRARAQALSASVEIMLSAGDTAGARAAAEELTRMAGEIDAPFLRAASAHADAAVALAGGDARAAADALREALVIWRDLDAPYHVAQARALLGLACRQLGDPEGARLELEAAHETFDRLGAAPEAARMTAWLASPVAPPSNLTGREVEVLRLIASGRTNRAIAAELAISEKTVARHISNIFTKLDLASRSAATAYAYEHKLV